MLDVGFDGKIEEANSSIICVFSLCFGFEALIICVEHVLYLFFICINFSVEVDCPWISKLVS